MAPLSEMVMSERTRGEWSCFEGNARASEWREDTRQRVERRHAPASGGKTRANQ